MTRLAQHTARLIALCLALAVFVGSVAMYAPSASAAQAHTQVQAQAQPQAQPHAHAHHAAMQDPATPDRAHASHACPSDTAPPTHAPHGDCAMVICCFSQTDSPQAAYNATLLPADYGTMTDPRLPQADPDRSDKPPKHT